MKKNSFLIFLSIISLLIITSCKAEQNNDDDVDTTNETNDGTTALGNKYHSKSGEFKINFPGEPEISTEETKTQIGNIDIIQYMYEDTSSVVYIVGYTDFPSLVTSLQSSEQILKIGQEYLIGSTGAKITLEKNNELSGKPGLYYEAQDDKTSTIAAVQGYLNDNRFFQIAIIRKDRMPTQDEIDNFIGTFEFAKN